ncbi:MAG: hypothetical protein U9N45_03565 [Gemmatimonadota bacterium]|nr:hypothetical protein [Gemmatimonadota bacterium]
MGLNPLRQPHRSLYRCKGISILFNPYIILLAALSLTSLTVDPALGGQEKIFIIRNTSCNLEDFRTYAELAVRLKQYGRVQVQISSMVDKSWHEIPEGGSPWHEWTCFFPTPWKFYPHPKIAPHQQADFVAKNREFLLAKAEVLRELGLEAMFLGRNSHFLPESFFEQYPGLRGPRVDHPRRSKEEAFALCVDQDETLEMIEWMMAELKRNVPEIQTFMSGSNDAGAGLCWAAALYPGPNGPKHCKGRNAGVRIRDLCKAVHRGAVKGGGRIIFRWGHILLWQNEMDVVIPLLPPNTFINKRDTSLLYLGNMTYDSYPILGLLDPLAVITAMEKYHKPGINTVMANTTALLRADDTPETVDKLYDVIEDCIREPTDGLKARLDKLSKMSARWAGEENRDKVFEALYKMHQAFTLKRALTPTYAGYQNPYCGVSMRQLTRPLVIKPDLLTPGEESYFLPHISNIYENEARMDYIDFQGERITGTARWDGHGLARALSTALDAARILESLERAPEGEWLKKLATSLRMWVSLVRSSNNFYHAQLIRDRYAEILAGDIRMPEKIEHWTGDEGNLEWNAIMRDEFDNTNELIELLENGGLELIAIAKDKRHEDTFLFGPDLVDQLRKKASIMRAHWLDVQDYLAPPNK